MTSSPSRILFVSSCFNEAENVHELYQRCRTAFERIKREAKLGQSLAFGMVIADNHSSDATLGILNEIVKQDQAVLILANSRNYGAEASFAHAVAESSRGDVIIGISSDLQDPPELAPELVRRLLQDDGCDAVLAVKTKSRESHLMRLSRKAYYLALGHSSRLRTVPNGFHGFGAYRFEAIDEALSLWQTTGLNLRMCLVNGSQSPATMPYRQAKRLHGQSSYRRLGYAREAIQALLAADSTASRLAFGLSGVGVLLASSVGIALLLNWLGGNSRYEPGVPTVMALVLGSFAIQMLMTAVLSRQVEELRLANVRPRVRHRRISHTDQL
jgi:glycosyltransferase involved in cell wall biosynthesis